MLKLNLHTIYESNMPERDSIYFRCLLVLILLFINHFLYSKVYL